MRNYDAKNWLFYIWMNWIKNQTWKWWEVAEF